MDGVSKRLRVTDNMGNSEILEPNSGEHFFPGSHVVEEEIPVAQFGKEQREDLVNNVGTYTNDYMNSPRYKEMLQNSSENTDEYNSMYDKRFKNLESINVNFPTPSFKTRFDKNILADADYKGNITMYPHAKGRTAYSTLAHEFSHGVDREEIKFGARRLIPQKDIELMGKYAHSGDIWNHLFSKENAKKKSLKEQKDRYLYLSEPTETRARLNDIRYDSKVNNIYDPFNQKVTPDILNGIRDSKSSDAYDDLKEIYTDDQIIDMLNTVSQTNRPPASIPIAKYGGLLNKTITCSNCGWSWKAADGGNDVGTCHKCGNENKVMEYGGLTNYQVGGPSYTVTGDNPLIIPSQGSYPLSYRDRGDRDADGVLFTNAKKVSRVDANGKPLTRNQIAYNQDLWNDQKEAYGPAQQAFNIWKNNEQNTLQGGYNPQEYYDMAAKLNKNNPSWIEVDGKNTSRDLKNLENQKYNIEGPSLLSKCNPFKVNHCIYTDEDKSGQKKTTRRNVDA